VDRKGLILVKIGGNTLSKLSLFLSFIKTLYELGYDFVLLHGGGNEINSWMEKLGFEPKFVKGRRITDENTLKIVEMVLSGDIQGKVISEVKKAGLKVLGLNGKSIFKCEKLIIDNIDLGYVGEVVEVDVLPIRRLLEERYVVVTTSLGMDESGVSYNINADSAALALGISLKVDRLIFCTDVPGVILREDDKDKVLNKLSIEEAKKLIEEEKVFGGMIPKLESAIRAIENGVKTVQIWGGVDFSRAWNMEEGTLVYKVL